MSDDNASGNGFEPTIIYFLCNWCGSGGGETAGAHHLQYPPNVIPTRVNCTGALPTVQMIRPLIEGADGVAISGCHPGDCHYNDGNFRARRRIATVRCLLDTLGLEGDRVWCRFVAHGEGKRFVDTAAAFSDHVKQLGPNPLKARSDT
jgi:F420-non-reducing hydrogenase iron-sulfur subunit